MHDGLSWEKVQIVPNLCSYGPKSFNFKVFMYISTIFMLKTIKIKKTGKNYCKKIIFAMK